MTSVLKVGGTSLDGAERLEPLCGHIASLVADGERVVVVHGGGTDISEMQAALGDRSEERTGLRVTSERGMDIVTMVLCGLVNKRVVAAFVSRGLPALGISGIDLGLLRAELLDEPLLGRVGAAPSVDAERLLRLLAAGIVPVVSPVSLGPDGAPVNVNADTAARAIAAALPADRLDLVTDVPGVRTSADAPGPVETLRASEADRLLRTPSIVRGGMHPKLQAAVAAVRAGVPSVHVGNLSSIRRGRSTEVVA